MYKDPEKKKAYQKRKQEEYRNDPEARARHAASVAKYLAKPEVKERRSKYGRERYAKFSKERTLRHRKNNLLSIGWTLEMIEVSRKEQGDACAICRKPFTETPHADHEHTTPPKPRALLCRGCNVGLGCFCDNPELLEEAAEYLRNWK